MSRALIADIVRHAANLTGYTPAQITGASRVRNLVRVRQAVCLIAREQVRHDGELIMWAYSYPQIGMALGDRDHSTVIHGCIVARNMAERDPDFGAFVTELRGAAASGKFFAKPKPEPAPPPVAPSTIVLFKPVPKSVRVWEDIELAGDHSMRLDQDGYTMAENVAKAAMALGSYRLATAILEARAA